MSDNDPELLKILDVINNSVYKPAIGFTKESTQVRIIQQNNTIIDLLLSLHKKLDIALATTRQESISSAIDDMSNKIKNLQLSPSIEDKLVVRTSQRRIYVWKDSAELIAEYKRAQHGFKNSQ